jgi:hypothetical protein
MHVLMRRRDALAASVLLSSLTASPVRAELPRAHTRADVEAWVHTAISTPPPSTSPQRKASLAAAQMEQMLADLREVLGEVSHLGSDEAAQSCRVPAKQMKDSVEQAQSSEMQLQEALATDDNSSADAELAQIRWLQSRVGSLGEQARSCVDRARSHPEVHGLVSRQQLARASSAEVQADIDLHAAWPALPGRRTMLNR